MCIVLCVRVLLYCCTVFAAVFTLHVSRALSNATAADDDAAPPPPPDRNSDRAIYLCALTPRLYATLRNGNPTKGCTRLLKYTKPFFSFIPNAIFLYPERERKRERVASSSSYRPEYKYTGRKKRSFFSHTCCSSLLAGVRYTHHRCRRSPGNEDVAAQDCAWASINNAVAVFPARGKFVARW